MGQKRNSIYDTAYDWYVSGSSLEQIADRLSVSRQSVFKAFKRRGFVLRAATPRPAQFFNGKKFTLRNNGYFALTTNSRCLMHRYVYEELVGKIPKGFDIHQRECLEN
jgi:hypothetical protein